MSGRPPTVSWLRSELAASRLAPDEPLPDAIRWIDCDDALRAAGGVLAPGRVSLNPDWVATLCRWRIAGLRPLVASATLPADGGIEEGKEAALEIDLLTGGTLDAIRLLPPPTLPIAQPLEPEPPPGHPLPIPDKNLHERIRGSLLGLAVGDCLGAPVENWPAEKIARVHGSFRDYVSGRGWGPGAPTRETTFALLWFREFSAGRKVHLASDRDRLGRALARWVTGRPRDFGHLTRGVLRGYLENPPVPAARLAWDRAGRRPEFNGALTRAAGVGAALPQDQDLRWASVLAASAMTNPAPVCLAAAIAVAEGVAAAIRGTDPLDQARACVWDDRVADALDEVDRGWAPGGTEWNGHTRGHPLKTLQAAFWAVRREASFAEALLDLAHLGGDADTHCAVAGALLGARHGPGGIPERWLAPLRVRPLIESLLFKYLAE